MNKIIEGQEIAEQIAEETGEWEGEGLQELSDMDATEGPVSPPSRMEFHVQMGGYTLSALEGVIIEAAAAQLSRKLPSDVNKRVQEEAIKMADKAITDKLAPIAKDLFDQPILTDKFVTKKADQALTLREYIGLVGREFLTMKVDHEGKPAGNFERGEPRINRIVSDVLDERFAADIKAAFEELRKEARAALDAKLNAAIAEERERLSKSLGYALEVKR